MKIKKSKDRVRLLLVKQPKLRDDDNKLLATAWFEELKEKGYNPTTMTAFDLLKHISLGNLSNSESIRRCRARLQEIDSSLRGNIYKQRHKETKRVKDDLQSFNI